MMCSILIFKRLSYLQTFSVSPQPVRVNTIKGEVREILVLERHFRNVDDCTAHLNTLTDIFRTDRDDPNEMYDLKQGMFTLGKLSIQKKRI